MEVREQGARVIRSQGVGVSAPRDIPLDIYQVLDHEAKTIQWPGLGGLNLEHSGKCPGFRRGDFVRIWHDSSHRSIHGNNHTDGKREVQPVLYSPMDPMATQRSFALT